MIHAAGIAQRKGNLTMKVRAKWSIKDGTGWHNPGEVFETESDLGDAVEVLSAAKKPKAEKKPEAEPEVQPDAEPVKEAEEAPVQETEKPRTTRRKVSK